MIHKKRKEKQRLRWFVEIMYAYTILMLVRLAQWNELYLHIRIKRFQTNPWRRSEKKTYSPFYLEDPLSLLRCCLLKCRQNERKKRTKYMQNVSVNLIGTKNLFAEMASKIALYFMFNNTKGAKFSWHRQMLKHTHTHQYIHSTNPLYVRKHKTISSKSVLNIESFSNWLKWIYCVRTPYRDLNQWKKQTNEQTKKELLSMFKLLWNQPCMHTRHKNNETNTWNIISPFNHIQLNTNYDDARWLSTLVHYLIVL